MPRARVILPGYTYDTRVARYRDSSRGQFVSRQRILDLLDGQIAGAEQRMGELTTALHEGRLAPVAYQSVMRDELRRVHLQNGALGMGGWDRMTSREFGRAGAMLREDYARLTNLVNGVAAGEVSLPQALNRVHAYIGNARVNFLAAEREANRQAANARGAQLEERRRLSTSEHCPDCVGYAALGWQPLGSLPVPGQGSVCGPRCRCTLERREVVREPVRVAV